MTWLNVCGSVSGMPWNALLSILKFLNAPKVMKAVLVASGKCVSPCIYWFSDKYCCVGPQPQKAKLVATPVDFTITPETLQNVQEVQLT